MDPLHHQTVYQRAQRNVCIGILFVVIASVIMIGIIVTRPADAMTCLIVYVIAFVPLCVGMAFMIRGIFFDHNSSLDKRPLPPSMLPPPTPLTVVSFTPVDMNEPEP